MGFEPEHPLGKGQLLPQRFLFKRPTKRSIIMSKETCSLPSFNIWLENHKKKLCIWLIISRCLRDVNFQKIKCQRDLHKDHGNTFNIDSQHSCYTVSSLERSCHVSMFHVSSGDWASAAVCANQHAYVFIIDSRALQPRWEEQREDTLCGFLSPPSQRCSINQVKWNFSSICIKDMICCGEAFCFLPPRLLALNVECFAKTATNSLTLMPIFCLKLAGQLALLPVLLS